jgi:anthranilate synthase/aminodeoxychorismate synthase-like glutamine amidotransferase
MKKILVLDNYDSFTWNLVHGLEAAGARCAVHRSDRIDLSQVEAFGADGIVLSPGPFGPDQTGICSDVVREFGRRVPILGVCLGMQVIATTAGATVAPSGRPVHGKASRIFHYCVGVLRGLPSPFLGARYHSLVVDPASVPEQLEVTAWADDGTIMGCHMRGSRVEGVLFHPESFMTEAGAAIFANFLNA